MPNQDILNYIQKKLEKGSSVEEIKGILLGHGWKEELIEEAFDYLKIEIKEEPTETLPKEKEENFLKIKESPIIETSSETQDGFPVLEPYLREEVESPIQEPEKSFTKPTEPIQENINRKKPSKKRFVIIIFIILFLIGGAAFAYYYTKEPLLVLSKALDTSLNVKSAETESQLKISFSDDLLEEINQGSDIKIEKENTIKTIFSFDYSDIENAKARVLLSKINENGYIELFFNDKTLYGRINDIDYSFFEKYGYSIHQEFINLVTGKWIKVMAMENKIQEGVQLKTDTLKLIKENPQIIKTIKRLPGEKILEIDTYHYGIELDKDKILNTIQTQDDINKYINVNSCEIWIGKKDNLIYKIFLDINIEGLTASEEGTTNGSINFQLTTNIYNQNKPVNAFEPQESIDIEELVEPFIIYQTELTTLETKDSSIKNYMDNLRTIAQLYKNESDQYSNKIIDNIDCDKSLAKTFLENSTGGYLLCENIQNNSDGTLIIKINNEKGANAKYCIQKTLNLNQTWCIDSAGFMGYEENCDSINFDCKKP